MSLHWEVRERRLVQKLAPGADGGTEPVATNKSEHG
jgi:hypothetical protein